MAMTRLLTEQMLTIQEQKSFLDCLTLEMKVLGSASTSVNY
jgi:hypothetical protein